MQVYTYHEFVYMYVYKHIFFNADRRLITRAYGARFTNNRWDTSIDAKYYNGKSRGNDPPR